MRILLTNDDGVHAEGLKVLERIARQLTDDVWVCAPESEQSGAGRSLTLSAPLRARQISEKHFAVSGTPTDCVMLALNDLMAAKPDLVLSGVNRGHNLGEDVSMSGTVAGAIQAMAMGVPGIALSQAFRARERAISEADMYKTADAFGAGIVQRLIQIGWPSDVVMNVNFPADPDGVEAVEVTRQGLRDAAVMTAEKRTDLRGRDYYWMGFRQHKSEPPQGTDLRAIYDGRISVTPLHIDLTHMETVHAMKGVLGGVPPKLADHSKPVEGP